MSISDSSILYRIGGDEFAVLMRNAGEEEVRALISKIEENLRVENKKNKGKILEKNSMSIGYAIFDPEQDASLYDTLKRADKMMYVEKRRGKEDLTKY